MRLLLVRHRAVVAICVLQLCSLGSCRCVLLCRGGRLSTARHSRTKIRDCKVLLKYAGFCNAGGFAALGFLPARPSCHALLGSGDMQHPPTRHSIQNEQG